MISLAALAHHQRQIHSRLRRVQAALAEWEEYLCAQAMPDGICPAVRQPTELSREALKELEGMLVNRVLELEELAAEKWGPRLN